MAGWNKPSGAAQPTPKKKPSAWRGAAAGLIVVAIGASCFFMFSGGDAKPKAKAEKKSSAIKEVKSVGGGLEVKKQGNRTLDHNDAVTATEEISQANVEAAKSEVGYSAAPSNTVVVFEKHGFKTGAEQILASVFMTEPGDMPPPLPTISFNSEADLIRHIDEMYEIKDDDSDRQKNVKETLNAVKKELDEYMRNGGDVNSFLDFYDKQLNQARELHLATKREIARAMAEDDMTHEQTIQYVRKCNKMLGEKGVKPVRLNQCDLDELHVTQEELEN